MDTGLSDHRAHNRPMDSQVLRVYWRPGCSSCVKVKEFLSQLGVDYQSINVSATPEAMDELRELGVRTVPVVARGREYVFAQALEDVSRFLGRDVRMKRLPPAALVQKWLQVLASAQHARQIIAVLEGFGIRPDEPLTEKDYSGLPMPKGLWG